MKKSIIAMLTLIVLFSLVIAQVQAAVPGSAVQHTPGQINYQGKLVNSGGSNYVDGVYTFDIRLFRVANSGTTIWGGTYSTYVKGGYFNIMLGGATGAALTNTTYTHTDLWKALWPDSATAPAEKNSLYLGITPYQDQNNVTITPASRAELSPRQNLLAAPYAFRAQTCEYANQSITNFVVNGTLTANYLSVGTGQLLRTYDEGSPLIPHVAIGFGRTPDNHVFISSKDLDLDAGALGMTLNSQGSVHIDAVNNIDIEAQMTATLKGASGAIVNGSTGPVSLEGTKIRGKNPLEWSPPSSPTTYSKPFKIYHFVVTINNNDSSADYDTGLSRTDYSAMIVGVYPQFPTAAQTGGVAFRMTNATTSFKWHILLKHDQTAPASRQYLVTVLTINRHLIEDDVYY